MPIVLKETDSAWRATQFRSLLSVKLWATRYRHAWHVKDGVLIVSAADGTIHRYMQRGGLPVTKGT